MCGSKPKKPKAPPKVVERDLGKESAESAEAATIKANEEAARTRTGKGSLMRKKIASSKSVANTAMSSAKPSGSPKLGG